MNLKRKEVWICDGIGFGDGIFDVVYVFYEFVCKVNVFIFVYFYFLNFWFYFV